MSLQRIVKFPRKFDFIYGDQFAAFYYFPLWTIQTLIVLGDALLINAD